LQAATANPARFIGSENDFGAVKPGKLANLVLLDSNPLDNIANTTKIRAVFLDGQFFDCAALDAMLANIAALANRKPIGDVLFDTIQTDGIHAAVDQYHQLAATHHDSYDFSENELVGFGYRLLHMQKVTEAIEAFKSSGGNLPEVLQHLRQPCRSLHGITATAISRFRTIASRSSSIRLTPTA
jgi:hypothetical protein